jgi:pimeloyl-ACP methyl ester carboxylesterase
MESESTSSNPGFWSRVGGGLKHAARASADGAKFLYRSAEENRHYLLPALNGLVGDKLAEAGHPLAIPMSLRVDGADAALDSPQIAALFKAKKRVVVLFLHGLMGDEIQWQAHPGDVPGYGPRLAAELGVTPLYLRYNTGRHISLNGRDLADLLDRLFRKYGSHIERLHIVAHSMGGLVTRSAGYYGTKAKHGWVQKLQCVALLGAPNDGSYLEKAGRLTTFILRRIWTLPTHIIARIAEERSDGIQDLRWGYLTDEDWQHAQADDLITAHRQVVPPLDHVRYLVLAGTLPGDAGSLVALYFGDGLVGRKSASGEAFRDARARGEEFVETRVLTGVSHLGLLNHADAYGLVKELIQKT